MIFAILMSCSAYKRWKNIQLISLINQRYYSFCQLHWFFLQRPWQSWASSTFYNRKIITQWNLRLRRGKVNVSKSSCYNVSLVIRYSFRHLFDQSGVPSDWLINLLLHFTVPRWRYEGNAVRREISTKVFLQKVIVTYANKMEYSEFCL